MLGQIRRCPSERLKVGWHESNWSLDELRLAARKRPFLDWRGKAGVRPIEASKIAICNGRFTSTWAVRWAQKAAL